MERLIIACRLKGNSFIEMEENDRRIALDKIIVRTAAISGCPLPNTDFFADAICEEMYGFMIDFGYEELTLSEITFALRMNMKCGLKYPTGLEIETIAFSGHCFNVTFVSKVLSNYMSLRVLLDRKLQNHIDGY
jgi:hypothetical protein